MKSALVVLLFAISMVAMKPALSAQKISPSRAFADKVLQLYATDRALEGNKLIQDYLTKIERQGTPISIDTANSLFLLALGIRDRKYSKDAENLYLRFVTILKSVPGDNRMALAQVLTSLGGLYIDGGRYAEAGPALEQSVSLAKEVLGDDNPERIFSLFALAKLYRLQYRHAEALPLLIDADRLQRKPTSGRGVPLKEFLWGVNELGMTYLELGEYDSAKRLLQEAVNMMEKVAPNAIGRERSITLLSNLALIYSRQGNYYEAEKRYKQALFLAEDTSVDKRVLANVLTEFSSNYQAQGRASEALPLLKLAMAKLEPGGDDLDLALLRSNLGEALRAQGLLTEAKTMHQLALTAVEHSGRNRLIATSLNNLGGVFEGEGDHAAAAEHFERALAVFERDGKGKEFAVAAVLNNLAASYFKLHRIDDATKYYQRALEVTQQSLGPNHLDVARRAINVSSQHYSLGKWTEAASYLQQAADIIIGHRKAQATECALDNEVYDEMRTYGFAFANLIRAAYRAHGVSESSDRTNRHLGAQMFEVAQWARTSEAARAIAHVEARHAAGTDKLAELVRNRQTLNCEYKAHEKLWIAAVSQNIASTQKIKANLVELSSRLVKVDATLASMFPEYARLTSSEPLKVDEVQRLLNKNEALILFLDTENPTPGETFRWVVTKTDFRWDRIQIGTSRLNEFVATLRCGLDQQQWIAESDAARCLALLQLKEQPEESPAPWPPFHMGKAYSLYQLLFGSVADMLQGKKLIVVPSGPLTILPFNVLLTKNSKFDLPSEYSQLGSAAWFGQTYAHTILPSVGSLPDLKKFEAPPLQDYIGYGNPVLKGGSNCEENLNVKHSLRWKGRRSPNLQDLPAGGSDPAKTREIVNTQCPLPESEMEIRQVAQSFRAHASLIRLEKSASERDIKIRSSNGELAKYRVLHFATHGVLAGDTEVWTKRQGEPALILTPPDDALDDDDDGLLLASEVAKLNTNADWVILSACSTASGNSATGEALSGLARAFMYAGARALLVSHWPVYSDAAVGLVTRIFRAKEHSNEGHAEALQRAMQEFIADDTLPIANKHPAAWAPFVVIGR